MNGNAELNRASSALPQRENYRTGLEKDWPEFIRFLKFPNRLAKTPYTPPAIKLDFLVGNR
jgi:hypothetical protein